MTATDHTKLSGIAAGAQVNVIETVKVNNVALTPSSKAVNVTVPTKTIDITNDSGFITIEDVPEGALPSSTTPLMDGTAAVGTEKAFARGDHRHPSDTSKVDVQKTINNITTTIDRNSDGGAQMLASTLQGNAYVYANNSYAKIGAEGASDGLYEVTVDSADGAIAIDTQSGSDSNSLIVTPTSTTITNVVTPTADSDAANKKYVDDSLGDLKMSATSTATVVSVTLKDGSDASATTITSANLPASSSTKAGTMSSTQYNKLAGIAEGAEVNVNADWNASSGDAQILNKPTTISGYGITDAYTKTEIDGKISGVFHYKGTKATVAQLPSSGNVTGDVWHVTATNGEYAWDGTEWQELGSNVDLSSYYTKTETDNLLDDKVDKVSGKGLSTNDYTTTEKDKLAAIEAGAEVNVIETVKVNGTALTVTSKAVDVTVPVAATTTPKMDGTAAVGTGTKWAKEDHVHPTDTSRASASDLTALTTRVGTAETKLSGISTGANKTEASSTNGNIKIDGTETNVYTLPSSVLDQSDTLILNCGTSSTNYT